MMKNHISIPLKKALPLLFICVIIVGIAGCTQQETTSTVGNDSGGSNQGAAVSATAKKVTVPSFQYYQPKAGNKYVAFNATVKNLNAKSRWIGTSYWQLRDTNGSVYTVATPTYSSDNPKEFKSVDSQPGDVMNGLIIFEVPQNAQLKSLTYDDGASKIILNM